MLTLDKMVAIERLVREWWKGKGPKTQKVRCERNKTMQSKWLKISMVVDRGQLALYVFAKMLSYDQDSEK